MLKEICRGYQGLVPVVQNNWKLGDKIEYYTRADLKQHFGIDYDDNLYVDESRYASILTLERDTPFSDSGYFSNASLLKKVTSWPTTKKEDIPWALCKIDDNVGWGVVATKDLPAYEFLGFYPGIKGTGFNDAYSIGVEHDLIISAAKHRGVLAHLQHAPSSRKMIYDRYYSYFASSDYLNYKVALEPLGKRDIMRLTIKLCQSNPNFLSELAKAHSDHIMSSLGEEFENICFNNNETKRYVAVNNIDTASVRLESGFKVFYMATRFPVKAGQQLLYDYGPEYWKSIGVVPELFWLNKLATIPRNQYTRKDSEALKSKSALVSLSLWKTADPGQAIRRAAAKSTYEQFSQLVLCYPQFINSDDGKPEKQLTPLHLAVQSTQSPTEKVTLLLKNSAKITNSSNQYKGGVTPIDLALSQNNTELLKAFCIDYYYPKVYKKYMVGKDQSLERLVRIAAVHNDIKLIQVLIAAKIKLDQPGIKAGKTAQALAQEKGFESIVMLLSSASDASQANYSR